jgi:hypothetical protein
MADPHQLGTYTGADHILPLPTKLVARYYFWTGPKTPLLISPQIVDSTHPIFASLAAQNHMFVGNLRKRASEVMPWHSLSQRGFTYSKVP